MTNDHDRNEKTLLDSMNDDASFAYIFVLYKYKLHNYAKRVLHDDNLAWDIVQDVFCSLYEKRKSIIISTSLKSYLYISVFNRAVDVYRKQFRMKDLSTSDIEGFYIEKVLQHPDEEIREADQIVRPALESALSKLPERCREILMLRLNNGLSNYEIAKKMNISIKTVEAQITIAYGKLRIYLTNIRDVILCKIFLKNS